MRKWLFANTKNKEADQLLGNREADQRFCFRYMDSTIPLLPSSEISSLQSPSLVVSDLVENPEDRYSHDEAQINRFVPCLCQKSVTELI